MTVTRSKASLEVVPKQDMTGLDERREHARFDLRGTDSSLSRVAEPSPDFTLEPCGLLNLSFGGMCCLVDKPLAKETSHSFLISLQGNLEGPVIVKARVQWVKECGPSWAVGATFLEASSGWFGPDTEDQVADC